MKHFQHLFCSVFPFVVICLLVKFVLMPVILYDLTFSAKQIKKGNKNLFTARHSTDKLCKWPKTHLKCRLISCGSSQESLNRFFFDGPCENHPFLFVIVVCMRLKLKSQKNEASIFLCLQTKSTVKKSSFVSIMLHWALKVNFLRFLLLSAWKTARHNTLNIHSVSF